MRSTADNGRTTRRTTGLDGHNEYTNNIIEPHLEYASAIQSTTPQQCHPSTSNDHPAVEILCVCHIARCFRYVLSFLSIYHRVRNSSSVVVVIAIIVVGRYVEDTRDLSLSAPLSLVWKSGRAGGRVETGLEIKGREHGRKRRTHDTTKRELVETTLALLWCALLRLATDGEVMTTTTTTRCMQDRLGAGRPNGRQ